MFITVKICWKGRAVYLWSWKWEHYDSGSRKNNNSSNNNIISMEHQRHRHHKVLPLLTSVCIILLHSIRITFSLLGERSSWWRRGQQTRSSVQTGEKSIQISIRSPIYSLLFYIMSNLWPLRVSLSNRTSFIGEMMSSPHTPYVKGSSLLMEGQNTQWWILYQEQPVECVIRSGRG